MLCQLIHAALKYVPECQQNTWQVCQLNRHKTLHCPKSYTCMWEHTFVKLWSLALMWRRGVVTLAASSRSDEEQQAGVSGDEDTGKTTFHRLQWSTVKSIGSCESGKINLLCVFYNKWWCYVVREISMEARWNVFYCSSTSKLLGYSWIMVTLL